MGLRSRWSHLPVLAAAALLAACSSMPTDSTPQFDGKISASYTGGLNITEVWFQGFETDVSGWFTPTRVASGTNGITSAAGGFHAEINDGDFTRFDGYSTVWPGAWIAEVDVYLDPAWAIGTGFDYSVASSKSDGNHLRDFIFHVGRVADGRLLVNGDNNAYGSTPNDYVLQTGGDGTPYEVTTAGWYTLQHIFYDDGGVLSVDLNLVNDQGTVVWTTTRTNAGDTIGTGGVVGGNRYGWFVFNNVPGLAADNSRRGVIVPVPGNKDDCKHGGWQSFGFRNQGQCVASIVSNGNPGT